MSYTFFFSHARDDFSPYMELFLSDLRETVRGKLGLAQNDPVSFRDKEEMDIGMPWRNDLLDGLQESMVMVCLYSPRYFQRSICGKEVGFYNERQKLLKTSPQHAVILPVIWIPCESRIPESLQGLTFDHHDFPPEYRTAGLEKLKKLSNKYGDKYLECVDAVAERIRKAVEDNAEALPQLETVPDLDDVPNGFETSKPKAAHGAPVNTEALNGPACVQFYYAIAKPNDLKGGPPSQPVLYDERGGPFYRCSAGGRFLGPLASNIASSPDLDMFPDNCELDEKFFSRLQEARQAKNPVVIFVDPWTLQRVERFRKRMDEYEEHRSDHCSVLVLWNNLDADTTANRLILEARVQSTFPVNTTRDKIHFRPDIASEQDLTSGLRETLERLRHKIIEQGKVERMLATTNKPTLDVNAGTGK